MKICTLCEQEKKLEDFPRDKYKKSGRKSRCKTCEADMARLARAKDPERSREISRAYRGRNKEKERARYTAYNKRNPEVRAFHSANRRAKKNNATPNWLSEDHWAQINLIYQHAKECQMLTGDKYHVDHIIPLNGENVSGLHVPWNLQVLPADINIAKGNRT